MIPHIQKQFAKFLLVILMWSCFGLGLGMIGQAFVPSHQHHEHITTTPDCCQTETNATATTDAPSDMTAHHTMVSAILISSKIFAMLVGVVLFTGMALVIHREYRQITFFYVQRWRDRWKFFALHLQHLFSAGILHPKTW